MNNQFDELTKSMAQSVTRRGALKKFSLGLAGVALACFGLVNKSEAAKTPIGPDKCNECIKECVAAGYSSKYCRQYWCVAVCYKY